MNEDIEQNNQEEHEQLTCPECGKGFQDMRGLTSHARHKHKLNKNELIKILDENENSETDNSTWKTIGGIAAFLATVITLGKFR